MYDIIGDIHGYARHLKALLNKLGYQHDGTCWRHPERKVIFLGDFIDRGPEQVEVVQIARAMTQAGQALAVMGNHEFNAIAWATPSKHDTTVFLREHSDKNYRQHADFLEQVEENSALHQEFIDWFKTLPVFLEFEGFRVVHACWNPTAINVLSPYLFEDARLKMDNLADLFDKKSPAFDAIETLLKGIEIALPAGHAFRDKDNVPRRKMRCKWWHKDAQTFQALAFVSKDVYSQIPAHDLKNNPVPGYDNEKPVFVGHYWLSGIPQKLTDSIACLDYSIAGDLTHGKLTAYRFNRHDSTINDKQFCWVGH